jgi:hypothetical protein
MVLARLFVVDRDHYKCSQSFLRLLLGFVFYLRAVDYKYIKLVCVCPGKIALNVAEMHC